MALSTRDSKEGREVLVKFRVGTCVDGIDYGPEHSDTPVWLPYAIARLHVDELGRAEYVDEDEDGAETEDADGGDDDDAELPFDPADVSLENLEAALAEIDDADTVTALSEADGRKGAEKLYQARFSEIAG